MPFPSPHAPWRLQEEPSLFQHCLADLGAPISHEHAHLTLLLGQQCVKTDYERKRADKAEQAAAALQAELDTALTQLEQERAVVVQEKASLLAEVQQERSRRKGLEQDLQQNGLLGQHLERDFDAELAHTQEQYAQVKVCLSVLCLGPPTLGTGLRTLFLTQVCMVMYGQAVMMVLCSLIFTCR